MTWVKLTTYLNVVDTQVFSQMNPLTLVGTLAQVIPGLVAIDDLTVTEARLHKTIAPLPIDALPSNYRQDTYRRVVDDASRGRGRGLGFERRVSTITKEQVRQDKCKVCNRKAKLRINWPDSKHHEKMFCTIGCMTKHIGRRKWWAKPQDAQCIREVVVK